MDRNIEFKPKIWHTKMLLLMVLGYSVLTFIFNWLGGIEFQIRSFVIGVVSMVVVYLLLVLFKKTHLSVAGDEVFLYGLKAELIEKRDIFGTRYIQITSNTERGYHRLTVTKKQIAISEWEFLLEKCS